MQVQGSQGPLHHTTSDNALTPAKLLIHWQTTPAPSRRSHKHPPRPSQPACLCDSVATLIIWLLIFPLTPTPPSRSSRYRPMPVSPSTCSCPVVPPAAAAASCESSTSNPRSNAASASASASSSPATTPSAAPGVAGVAAGGIKTPPPPAWTGRCTPGGSTPLWGHSRPLPLPPEGLSGLTLPPAPPCCELLLALRRGSAGAAALPPPQASRGLTCGCCGGAACCIVASCRTPGTPCTLLLRPCQGGRPGPGPSRGLGGGGGGGDGGGPTPLWAAGALQSFTRWPSCPHLWRECDKERRHRCVHG